MFGPPAPSCPLSSREKDVNSCIDLWWSQHHQSSGTRSGNKKKISESVCWAARLAWVRSRDVSVKDFHLFPGNRSFWISCIRERFDCWSFAGVLSFLEAVSA